MTGTKTYFLQAVAKDAAGAWFRWACSEERTEGEGELASLVDELAAHPVVLLVPGAKVRCFDAKLPAMSVTKLRQALPFAIEDDLADDVDDCHLAIFAVDSKSGVVAAGVINKAELAAMSEPLLGAGVNLLACVPEHLLLPWQDGSWTMVVDKQWCWLRQSRWQGCTLPTKELALALAALTKDAEAPEQVQVTLLDGLTEQWFADVAAELARWLEQGEATINVTAAAADSVIPALSGAASQRAGILADAMAANLLQGEFKVKPKRDQSTKLWWATATAWVLVAVVFLGGKFYQHHVLTNKTAAQQQQILSQYQRVFPGATTANSPHIVFERELAQLQQGAQDHAMLPEMSALGEAMQRLPGTVLENLSYLEQRMTVSLSLTNFSALEKLVDTLQQHGLQVKKDAAVAKGKRVQARLQITRDAA